jgi:hypothetical protein
MENPMINRLAELHAEYNIYPEHFMRKNTNHRIIHYLERFPETKYLAEIYQDYLSKYHSNLITLGINPEDKAKMSGKIARSVDLPFIGKNVLDKNKPTFMIIFNGSLQKEKKLSVTVLSCFWLFENAFIKHESMVKEYWKEKPFTLMLNSLKITPKMAQHAYIVDAFRISNGVETVTKANKEDNQRLLIREAELIKPDLILQVGTTTSNIVRDSLKENGFNVDFVNFPGTQNESEIPTYRPDYDRVRTKFEELLRQFEK